MKKESSVRKIGMILLLLCFVGFAQTSSCQTSENLPEPSETIYVSVFISYIPAYGTFLTKYILIDFNDINGPPINTSIPAFDEYFREAKYELIPWGAEGLAVRVSAFYDSQISNDTADEYTNFIREEFLRVFNQTNLSLFDKGHIIDNATKTIRVHMDSGFIQGDLTSIENLIKYKPDDGFGQLITRDFLSLFIPGNFSCGLTDLTYTLYKADQNTIYWRFTIGYATSIDEKFISKEEDVNLSALLKTSSSIQPSHQRHSRIMIEIQKNAITPTETYSMNLESISPAFTGIEENGTILVTYDLTGPIDNMSARISIRKEKPGFDWNVTYVTIAIILAIISVSGITVFLLKKKRKRR